MVHIWVSLVNNSINKSCENKKILKIFKDGNSYFYGDYNLDILMSSKNEHTQNLETFVSRLNMIHRDEYQREYTNLYKVIEKFGWITNYSVKKIFPRRENMNVNKTITICNNGNYMILACETDRFYYLFNYVTS